MKSFSSLPQIQGFKSSEFLFVTNLRHLTGPWFSGRDEPLQVVLVWLDEKWVQCPHGWVPHHFCQTAHQMGLWGIRECSLQCPSFLPHLGLQEADCAFQPQQGFCSCWDVLVKNPPPLENRSPGSVVVDYGEKEDNLIAASLVPCINFVWGDWRLKKNHNVSGCIWFWTVV